MATWHEIEQSAPELAEHVRRRFEAHRHHTLATLRRDGSPRISGIEVKFDGDEVYLGMMSDSLKAADLRRDPRIALHSHSEDPPESQAEAHRWSGDAKIAGRAAELPNEDQPGEPSGRFRIDLTEAVFIRVGDPPDHLLVESWHAHKGYRRRQRR